MDEWLIEWRDSKQLGLTKQTFNALICTAREWLSICSNWKREQTDPLEKRFSLYRRMSGGRFLVNLIEVLQSESIVKMKITQTEFRN